MIRIALQKSGRLTEETLSLFKRCGLQFNWSKNRLLIQTLNFPAELLLVRDDDIPEYVRNGTCDLGFVGKNVLVESECSDRPNPITIKEMEYGQCRLSIAVPENFSYQGIQSIHQSRIATSYPNTLRQFLQKNNLEAEIIEISGSVEVAPKLGIADIICDLVSTGSTLRSNKLTEVESILNSQCLLIKTPKTLSDEKSGIVDRLLNRLSGVLRAQNTKYIMMNAPRNQLETISTMLPGMEKPSIMAIDGRDDLVAVHAVCREDIFWETMEKLKEIGARSILVVPIEKILE